MRGEATGRQTGMALLAAAALVLTVVLPELAQPVEWTAVLETWESCLAGGPLWWLLRTALALANGVLKNGREERAMEERLSKRRSWKRSQREENRNGDEMEKRVRIEGESFSLIFVFVMGIVLLA